MNIRCQCVEILQEILEQKVFFSALKAQIEEKDVPFANMLVLTALRHRTSLDKIIAGFVSKKIPDKMRILTYVLYCGATEILYMDTPDYAAINEYVTAAKKCAGRFAGGMVNAVLRKIASNKSELLKKQENGLPRKFQKLLGKDYNKDDIEKIASVIYNEPPLDITVKQNAAEWAGRLEGELFANGTIRLKNPKSKIPSLPGFAEGGWWVQDLAASLPVLALGDVKGLKVLDLCAAPGGKTAQLLAAGALVWAVDSDNDRMERLKKNIKRLRMEANLNPVVMDAVKFMESQDFDFDVILIDAPCSATGTFRRHPEVLHIKDTSDIIKQSEIQKVMLDCAAQKLKPGGRIVYCTCSISTMESEKQIEQFLTKYCEFELMPISEDLFANYEGIKLSPPIFNNGVIRSLPFHMAEHGGMDSFYAACLKKRDTLGEHRCL